MNKRILLTLIFVLAVALSVGTIYASDANVTDSYAASSPDNETIIASDEASELQATESVVDNDSSNDVLKSEDSSTLSTNIEDSNVITSDNNNNAISNSIDISQTITAKDVTKYYKGTAKYTAKFLYTNGSAVANADIQFILKGKLYTKKTDSNGIASLELGLEPGTYSVVAKNPYTGYSLTSTIKIMSTIVSDDLTKVYMDSKKYSATFLKSNGKVVANKKVRFQINGKTYKVRTDSKGVAKISLKDLPKGTYKIVSYNRDGLTQTNTVKVVKSAKTSLKSYNYIFLTSDKTKKVKVKLLNEFGYSPDKGKVIIMKIDGKKYTGKTSTYGKVKFKLPALKAGVYKIKFKFPKTGYYKGSSVKYRITVIPSKDPTYVVKSTTTFGEGAGTAFKVALTSGNVPIAYKQIKLTVNGQSYTKTTNGDGIVSLPINLKIGTYTVKYTNVASSKVNAKTGSTQINVVKRTATSLSWKSATTFYQGTQSVKLLLLDSKSKALAGQTVKLTVNSKDYTGKTDSQGYVTLKASFTPGTYSVSYQFGGDNLNLPTTASTKLTVKKIDTISIKNVIAGAKTVKSYYEKNDKLPSTVTAGGITFTMPEFLYVMSEAIANLGSSNTGNVPILTGVKAPSSPSGDTINSVELYKKDYITVAKNAVTFIKNNKQAPNYANSAVGKIIYKELGDAFSRILAFYGNNDNYLPNYCVITYGSGSSSSQGGTGLNEKNTVKDTSIYLKSTSNCQVGSTTIKKAVANAIGDRTDATAKAKAIYNFVRDSISYSFYYDTHYGAVGTYNNGAGNCVDQAHLLVAMYRTAGLPARYVHGTCTFSSGSTYGHVWAQVLIGNNWHVVDPTSSRNSFGTIVNWNTNSYSFQGTYASLPF